MAVVTAGWLTCSLCEAAVMLDWSATTAKVRSRFQSSVRRKASVSISGVTTGTIPHN